MANPKRGIIDIELDGEMHQMRFTLGAIEEIEEAFGGAEGTKTAIGDIFSSAGSWSARDFTTIFVAALKRGTIPEATPDQVKEMLVIGDFAYYAQKMGEAMNASNTGKTKLPPRPTGGVTPTTTTAPTGSISTN